MTIVASAPGKIVLAGEYAVLFGAPAICMAVDRRAVARLRPASDCHVHTPGFTGGDPFGIVDAVSPHGRPAFEIELDTSAFAEQGNKIGIGSSAALTVALTAALEGTEDVLEHALAAHSRFQGRAGSGVDVATAVRGGLVRYTQSPRSVRALEWPEGLGFRVIWTGVAVSTAAKLDKLFANPARMSRTFFSEATSRIADAWCTGRADDVLAAYKVMYIEALRRFSVDHDLGIFDAGHEELTEAAMADGLIYKPAGAGGGDVGVLLGCSEDALDGFIDRHPSLVHSVISCALDPGGVRLEPI